MKDLNDIYLFSAVVTHKGFSAAARALDIPKSRLSKRVAYLETQLGVRLLERSTRAIRVTEVGQAFFEKCEAVLSGVEAAEAIAAESLSAPKGTVRISCPPALAKLLLQPALPGFAARFPHVRILVSALNRPVDLVEDRIDVALRARSNLEANPDLMMAVLGRGSSFLVASPQFVTAREPITIETILNVPTLSTRDNADRDTWHLMGSDKQHVEIAIEPRIACNDFDLVLTAARAGLGVALLPQVICQKPLVSGELVRVLPEWAGPESTVHLVFTSRRGLRPAVRALIDHLKTASVDMMSG